MTNTECNCCREYLCPAHVGPTLAQYARQHAERGLDQWAIEASLGCNLMAHERKIVADIVADVRCKAA